MDPIILKRLKITGIVLGIILGIILIALITIYIIDSISYGKYDEKMKDWGFEKVYGEDNFIYGMTKNGEAVNAIVNVLYDPYGIKEFGYKSDINHKFGTLVKFAEINGMITKGEITDKNINKNITKEKANEYLNAGIKNILEKDDTFVIDELLGSDRSVLSYITNKIYRRDLNIVLIKLIEKYSLIDVENRAISIENLPINAIDYPYIVSAIPNEVYQIPYIVDNNKIKEFKKPKDLFNIYKSTYTQIKDRIEEYYNTILNVDYNKMNREEFINKIESLMQFKGSEKGYDDYIEYVTKNKIIVKGEASVLLPIMYYDGSTFRVRTKLEFTTSASIKENLLFGDKENDKVNYEQNSYVVYVDVPLEQSLITDSLYVTVHSALKNEVK